MGGISDFLFGKPSKETSSNSSSNSSQSGNYSYNTLNQALAPTLGYGAQAGSQMAGLLGLPSYSPQPAPSSYIPPASYPSPSPTPSGGSGMGAYDPSSQTYYPNYPKNYFGDAKFDLGSDYGYTGFGNSGTQSGYSGGIPNITGTPAEQPNGYGLGSLVPSSAPVTGASAGSALDNFANSAGMDFMRNQGVKAIEASQAGKGMLQSGSTGQALTTFGNNLAKGYLNDYLNHLNDYASLGTKSAAVLSGAGGYSQSNGLSSGSGSGTGAKNGLFSSIAGNPGLGTAIAAFA